MDDRSLQTAQHPMDARVVAFDFYSWRIMRRWVADHLRGFTARVRSAIAYSLHRCAEHLESETVDMIDAECLSEFFGLAEHGSQCTLTQIMQACRAYATTQAIPIISTFPLPCLDPDWSQIRINSTAFCGHVDGIPLCAHPPQGEVDTDMPDYTLVWLRPNTSADDPFPPLALQNATCGTYLDYGPAVWDWMVARRLTLECLSGRRTWPQTDEPPLLLARKVLPTRG